MAIISWEKDYELGIRIIDEQHRGLVDLINKLHDAMRERRTKEVLSQIINEMQTYYQEHFSTEEKFFDEYNYPDAVEHKQEHAEFKTKVNEFAADHDSGKVMLSIDIINYLRDWLIEHINGTDKLYAPFLKGKGI